MLQKYYPMYVDNPPVNFDRLSRVSHHDALTLARRKLWRLYTYLSSCPFGRISGKYRHADILTNDSLPKSGQSPHCRPNIVVVLGLLPNYMPTIFLTIVKEVKARLSVLFVRKGDFKKGCS